jgi:hypothetical protein
VKLQSMEEIKKNLEHMDLSELIKGGYFKNRYIFPAKDDYQIKKVCEHCGSKYIDDEQNKKYAEAKHRYHEEEGRLYNLFKDALFYEFKVEHNDKKEKAFSIAWSRGHADGLYEVYQQFSSLSELLE